MNALHLQTLMRMYLHAEPLSVPREKSKAKYSCKYPACKNSIYPQKAGHHNKRFHSFPKDPDILELWKSVCRISDSQNCVNFHVCGDHFKAQIMLLILD